MINSGWIQNSCAIRGTMAVRALGLEPGEIGNTRWTDGSGRKYLIRVLEFDQFLRTYLGPPSWVGGAGIRTNQLDAEGKPIWAHPAELRGAGIIRYSQCGFGDASGHSKLLSCCSLLVFQQKFFFFFVFFFLICSLKSRCL